MLQMITLKDIDLKSVQSEYFAPNCRCIWVNDLISDQQLISEWNRVEKKRADMIYISEIGPFFSIYRFMKWSLHRYQNPGWINRFTFCALDQLSCPFDRVLLMENDQSTIGFEIFLAIKQWNTLKKRREEATQSRVFWTA